MLTLNSDTLCLMVYSPQCPHLAAALLAYIVMMFPPLTVGVGGIQSLAEASAQCSVPSTVTGHQVVMYPETE